MPFCRQCGNLTVESDQFCAKCGAAIVTPSAVPGEPQASDARPIRRRHRVTLIVVVVVVLVVIACALVFGLGYVRRDRVSTATLPVHVLPTEVAATSPTYPSAVTVRLPRNWLHALSAYGVAGTVLLAPAGWTVENALIGQDGSCRATLRATSGSAISGQVDYESEQVGNVAYIWQTAAEYFPWVRSDWSSTGGASASPPAPLPGLVEQPEGTQVVRYSVRSGDEVDSGLQVNGVARTTLRPNDLSTPGFDRLEVALPPQDHALATIILDYYVTHNGQ
jgi:hypothetical protein